MLRTLLMLMEIVYARNLTTSIQLHMPAISIAPLSQILTESETHQHLIFVLATVTLSLIVEPTSAELTALTLKEHFLRSIPTAVSVYVSLDITGILIVVLEHLLALLFRRVALLPD